MAFPLNFKKTKNTPGYHSPSLNSSLAGDEADESRKYEKQTTLCERHVETVNDE